MSASRPAFKASGKGAEMKEGRRAAVDERTELRIQMDGGRSVAASSREGNPVEARGRRRKKKEKTGRTAAGREKEIKKKGKERSRPTGPVRKGKKEGK